MKEPKRPVGKPRHYPEEIKQQHSVKLTDTVWNWAKAQHPRGVSGFIESLYEAQKKSPVV